MLATSVASNKTGAQNSLQLSLGLKLNETNKHEFQRSHLPETVYIPGRKHEHPKMSPANFLADAAPSLTKKK